MKDESNFIAILRTIERFIPGNYLKTFFYLNFISRPRQAIRLSLNSFYRMDYIFGVLNEIKQNYKGHFSILEFGVADGYSFTKKLYATKYLKMDDRVMLYGFDTFEGMPEAKDIYDKDIIANDGWVKGQFKGNYESLNEYCSKHYNNFSLFKGYFEDSLDITFLEKLKTELPILIWIDCDYYSSAKVVFDRLIPFIPNGCVIYFDEYEFNYGSRFTGEAKIVYEINSGKFGDGIELVLDSMLSMNSQRIYRMINLNNPTQYQRLYSVNDVSNLRRRTNDSPLP